MELLAAMIAPPAAAAAAAAVAAVAEVHGQISVVRSDLVRKQWRQVYGLLQ